MDHEVGPWKMAFFSMVRVHASLKFSVESLGPLVGCNPNVDQEEWACTKRERVDFFNTSPKRAFLKKRSLTILLSSLGLHLSSLLDMSKLWLANLLTTIFTKRNERFNLYMFNIIYMWHVPYVVTIIKLCKKRTAIVFTSRFFWPPWSAIAKWLHFFFCNYIYFWWECNIPLEMYFQELLNSLSQVLKLQTFELVDH